MFIDDRGRSHHLTVAILYAPHRCRSPFRVVVQGKEYIIPKGHQVAVSPTINGRLSDEWDDPETFDFHRFLRVEVGIKAARARIEKKGC